ncbi:AI-2E family transporter [Afifella sp. H1R]|uniref:AI-2E family transporter n=1 Tax=Afifella sp. H1R TaxID=2908841 RepID=UPI001F206245|nr:AI-2E family transporter [Afifella sp. H1R]MCF1503085.1 AI-2E family transporter [Afifella sp. H1R]
MTSTDSDATARPSDATPQQADAPPEPQRQRASWPLTGLFLIALIGSLYLAKGFFLPVVLAFLFALVLSPVVRFFSRRGIAEWVTGALLVSSTFIMLVGGSYILSDPIGEWVDRAPSIARELERKVGHLRGSVAQLERASKEVDKITTGKGGSAPDAAQEVVLREPGLLSDVATSTPDILARVLLCLVLLFFLLAYSELFYVKLVRSMPSLSDKKRALRIAHDIERELSRYLFTVTFINTMLGIAIGSGMWVIGMPNPVLWGILATLLNFIPYVGSMMGIGLSAVVGIVTFPTLGEAFYPPLIYLFFTAMEGNFITPMVVGRRLEMNPVAVFLSIAFWGWLWGFVGMFMAVPLLVAIKIFATNIPSLGAVAEFLSGDPRRAVEEPEEADEASAPSGG